MQVPDDRTTEARRLLARALAMLPYDITEDMLLERCDPARIAKTMSQVYDEMAAAFAALGGEDSDIEAVALEVAEYRLLPGRRYPWREPPSR